MTHNREANCKHYRPNMIIDSLQEIMWQREIRIAEFGNTYLWFMNVASS